MRELAGGRRLGDNRERDGLIILAQTGSYVPADAASLGVVDRIFTRVSSFDWKTCLFKPMR